MTGILILRNLLTCSILPFSHHSWDCRCYVASHEFPLCPQISVVNVITFHEANLLIRSSQLPIQWNIPLTNYWASKSKQCSSLINNEAENSGQLKHSYYQCSLLNIVAVLFTLYLAVTGFRTLYRSSESIHTWGINNKRGRCRKPWMVHC